MCSTLKVMSVSEAIIINAITRLRHEYNFLLPAIAKLSQGLLLLAPTLYILHCGSLQTQLILLIEAAQIVEELARSELLE